MHTSVICCDTFKYLPAMHSVQSIRLEAGLSSVWKGRKNDVRILLNKSKTHNIIHSGNKYNSYWTAKRGQKLGHLLSNNPWGTLCNRRPMWILFWRCTFQFCTLRTWENSCMVCKALQSNPLGKKRKKKKKKKKEENHVSKYKT